MSSNQDERLVEKALEQYQMILEAWDTLLTGTYTLDQISVALASNGYILKSGRHWAWNETINGSRLNA